MNEFFIPKTRVLGLSVGEDFVILACIVFIQCQRVTDRRADRRTYRHPDVQGLHSSLCWLPVIKTLHSKWKAKFQIVCQQRCRNLIWL